MKEMLKKMMEKKKDKSLPENEKNAKLSILKDLMAQADGKMFDPIKKLSAATADKMGFDMDAAKAKEVLEGTEDHEDKELADGSPEELSEESEEAAELVKKIELLKQLKNKK